MESQTLTLELGKFTDDQLIRTAGELRLFVAHRRSVAEDAKRRPCDRRAPVDMNEFVPQLSEFVNVLQKRQLESG